MLAQGGCTSLKAFSVAKLHQIIGPLRHPPAVQCPFHRSLFNFGFVFGSLFLRKLFIKQNFITLFKTYIFSYNEFDYTHTHIHPLVSHLKVFVCNLSVHLTNLLCHLSFSYDLYIKKLIHYLSDITHIFPILVFASAFCLW